LKRTDLWRRLRRYRRRHPDAEKRKRGDFVVDTFNGLDPVHKQIREILE
jgi:dephospho-CoA kinase